MGRQELQESNRILRCLEDVPSVIQVFEYVQFNECLYQACLQEGIPIALELSALSLLGTDDLQVRKYVHDLYVACSISPALSLSLNNMNHIFNDPLNIA